MEEKSALRKALDRLTIRDIAQEAGLELTTNSRDGYGHCLSPFREERTPSFHMSPKFKGKIAKDFGDGKSYNVWTFAENAFPDDSKGDLAKRIIGIAGIADNAAHLNSTRGSSRAEARRENERNLKKSIETWNANRSLPPAAKPFEDPDFISERYYDNGAGPSEIESLAVERGWPLEWAEEIATSQISYCPLPWTEKGRGWSFPLICPFNCSSSGPVERKLFCGYHQRFLVNGKNQWVFVPYLKDGYGMNSFRNRTIRHYRKKGFSPGDSIVEPMPYVIGDIINPKLVIIAEGQWDAITLFGALGGFTDSGQTPVCVFGLRGVNGASKLLSYWGRWLQWLSFERRVKSVWLLCDNDQQGKSLLSTDVGNKRPPFNDWIQEAIGCRTVASYFNRSEFKDFNDYWKKRTPSYETMWQTITKLKLI